MVFRFVINMRYVDMMKFIRRKNPNMREIARETRFAYPQIREVLMEWETKKLIEPVFNNPDTGRDYNIHLTGAAKIILKHFEDIEGIVRRLER